MHKKQIMLNKKQFFYVCWQQVIAFSFIDHANFRKYFLTLLHGDER